MTPAEKVDDINRLLGIFNQGCSNVMPPHQRATACDECTSDILRRIQKVVSGEAAAPPRS